ncbi:MAG: hypothetical protein ACE5K8_07920 [Candidatus Zixiibacteriota bacterium]
MLTYNRLQLKRYSNILVIAYSAPKVEYLTQTICGPTGRLQPVLETFVLIVSKIADTVSAIIPLWPDLPEHIKAAIRALIKTTRA